MTEAGTYLYAIASDPPPDTAPDRGTAPPRLPAGILGAGVRAVRESGLVAYVGTVPLAEFGEAALRRNLEDLAWLEATARAHHRVVDAIAEAGPVAPVRLVTVYRGDDQVRDLLRERAGEFAGVLAGVTGRKEWGVKVYATPEPEPAAGAAAPARDAAAGSAGEERSPGTAYLRRRRTSLRSREETWQRAVAHAREIDAALAGIAVAVRHHRPQDPQLSGRSDWMVLNGAYLVDDERATEFTALADRLRAPGFDVQLTGPWAPYSFTITEAGAEGER